MDPSTVDPADVTNFINAIKSHYWVGAVAIGLVYVTRLFGRDTKWLPDVVGKYKPLILLCLNVATFVTVKVAAGMTWDVAIGLAFLSFSGGLGLHSVAVLPTGKELYVPDALKKDEFKKKDPEPAATPTL